MKGRTEVTLNTKGITLLIGLIAVLVFTLGFVASRAGRVEAGNLTVQDLDMIKKIQVMLTPEEKENLSFQKEANGDLVIRISMAEE